jgi:predicted DNA-binding mobile mystery protein A
MVEAYKQIDKRLSELRPLTLAARPARGWIRAIRESLGMTMAQFAKRLGVSQPRVVELEQAELTGAVTLKSLERAAEALGCRVVYLFVPNQPLAETIRQRVLALADRQLASVEQSMRLEAQGVGDKDQRKEAPKQVVERLLRHPARLWDDP